MGIEPMTFSLPRRCSATEPRRQKVLRPGSAFASSSLRSEANLGKRMRGRRFACARSRIRTCGDLSVGGFTDHCDCPLRHPGTLSPCDCLARFCVSKFTGSTPAPQPFTIVQGKLLARFTVYTERSEVSRR